MGIRSQQFLPTPPPHIDKYVHKAITPLEYSDIQQTQIDTLAIQSLGKGLGLEDVKISVLPSYCT